MTRFAWRAILAGTRGGWWKTTPGVRSALRARRPVQVVWRVPAAVHLFELGDAESGERVHLFGADAPGRDLFARVPTGQRVSLVDGPYVLPLVALLGGASGHCCGWVDFVLQRLGKAAVALPGLRVLLVVGCVGGASRIPAVTLIAVLGASAAVGWGEEWRGPSAARS
ncbi:MAG: hypothetical protein PHU43_09750 [Candidatus Bipolaricaulis sp.]|nr:hypothetical protein [Candidatus Bipolaricaulis sp.]